MEIPNGVNEAPIVPVPETPKSAEIIETKVGFWKKKRVLALVLVAVLVLGGGGVWLRQKLQINISGPKWQDVPVGLVADKVSKGATITINLPKTIQLSAADAKDKITFEPKISGSFSAGPKTQELLFKPDQPLDIGKDYKVTVATAGIVLAKDFIADEDPKVDAIFPKEGTEAPETSAITIVFNRPMVPLTTLDQQYSVPIPVNIKPATSGKFKWITTRNLQFIPDTRLARSSNYTVSIGSGFVSMDGLPVAAMESHFTTRPLRYESDTIHHAGFTLYNEPVTIRFNQPVDLNKTSAKVEVKSSDGKNVSFLAEYGARTAYLGTDQASLKDFTDKSVINIYPQKDKFGRAKFWDFNTDYTVTINGAIPLEGDILLTDSRTANVQVPDILASVAADSQRSNLVESSLFDPQGHLVLNFYEDIDKDKSQINAPGLKGVSYGQQCKLDSDGNPIYQAGGSDCQKEDNKKQFLISFDDKQFHPGQNFDVELAKLVNPDGLQLNAQSIHESMTVYPIPQIFSTSPQEGDKAASITDLVLCSNTPIVDAQVETFAQMFKSNYSVGKWNWDQSYKVAPGNPNEKCSADQFDSHIHYGLRPEANYQIQLSLSDPFGQNFSQNLNFTSGKIDSQYTQFNSLQKNYNVAAPGQTKLTYAAVNLDYVDLQVCQISAQVMLQYLDPDTAPSQTTPGEKLNCQQSWNKTISLPPKYWDLNYFQVDIKDVVPVQNPIGFYVLSFTNPNLREQVYDYQTGQTHSGAQIYPHTLLNVTSLAAQEKKVEVQPGSGPERGVESQTLSDSQGNLYWVTSIGSMDPVSGAAIQVYQQNDKGAYSLFDTSQTGQDGIARTKAYSGNGAAIVTSGTDSTIVSSATDKFQWSYGVQGGEATYIYSDRPIYRPGQQVFIKGLNRIGYDDVYQIYQDKPATLEIFDSKNTSVYKEDLPVGKHGTFNTTFTLPSDAPLGTYRVEALGGYYNFDVEEYVPSAFKLDMSTDKDEYIAGDSFTLNVNANYYFGVPLEGGKVEYSVTAQDYYFDRYQDATFQFGGGWYYSNTPSFGDSFILRGKADIDNQGKAQITQKLDFSQLFSGDIGKRSKIFDVHITVTNTTGQAVSGEQSFIVHRGEFYLGAALQKDYFAKNDSNKILLKTVDTKGKEVSVSGISGTINKISWNYFKRQEVDGSYYYTSEEKKDKVQDFTASTDGQGNFSKDFTVADEGEYELDVTATDTRGNQITGTESFYVYGQGTVDVQPLNNESLDIAVQNSQLEVGQSASMVIKSPFKKAKALIAVERGRILDYQIVDVDQNLFHYSVPVKEAYVPNFYVTVLLLSPDPQVRFGQSDFNVDVKQKTITVDVKPDKNNYLPGENVTLDVNTKDASGKAVSADVSLSIADLSMLALAGNPKKDPVSFFYNGMPLAVTTSSNLKNILEQAQIPTGTKGGSGAEPGDLATKKRGVFKDTAYWNADVETGQDGHAQITFTLPDNLTTWQVESLGMTDDTKLGVGYQQFVAKKQLMVTPLVPRFIIPGDEFVVGGKVFNQTGSSQNLTVSLDTKTLETLDKTSQSVTLASGQTQTVYFKVRAPQNLQTGQHTLNITAKNDSFTDSVDSSFPINQNQTYEAVATSNYTTDATASEYVWLPNNVVMDKGGLQIKANATLAGIIPDALNYLVDYPYGCTEQMMSKLSAVATAKRFTKIKNLGDKFKLPEVLMDGQSYSADDVVAIGLARIMANQNSDGGFGYYPQMGSDYYLTLDVLNALEQLRAAGYKIDDAAESRAVAYTMQTFNDPRYGYFQSNDTVILTAYTFSNVPSASQQLGQVMPRVYQLGADTKYLNEDISNLSLSYLGLLLSNGQSSQLSQKVLNTLENRVVIDGRGAYLGGGSSQYVWQYYETPVKDTALLMKVLSDNKQDYVAMDKILRWLQNSRSTDGSWGSTNNTATVLDALVDYLQFKPENLSNFSLDLLLDGKSQGSLTFGSNNIMDYLQNFIPVSSFAPDKLSQLQFVKKNLNDQPNGFYYDMSLKYYLPINGIAPRDEGFGVERNLYALDDKAGKTPLSSAKVGQVLRGHLKITITRPRNFVATESFIPAGAELVNFGLATTDQTLQQQGQTPPANNILGYQLPQQKPVQLAKPGFWSRIGLWFNGLFHHKSSTTTQPTASSAVADLPDEAYSGDITQTNPYYPDSTEYHDDRLLLFSQHLDPGVYEYDYYVRALIPGSFQTQPAVASELYLPENFGRSGGVLFTVTQ